MVARTVRKSIRRPTRQGRSRRLGVSFDVGHAAPALRPRAPRLKRPGAPTEARSGRLVRRRFGPPNLRRRGIAGGGSAVQLTYWKHKVGRSRKPTLGLVRTLALNRLVVRYQGLNRLGSVSVGANPNYPGYHPLEARLDTTAGASFLPLHIYELSSVNNGLSRPAGYRCVIQDNGSIGWLPLNGMASDGTTVAAQPYLFEFGDCSSVQSQVRFVNLLWSDIKIMLHGALAETATYDISIISFDPRYLFLDPAETTAGFNSQELQQYNSFWQTMTRSLITNPCMHGNQEKQYGMRVQRSVRHILQPSSNMDVNDEPASRLVHMFVKQHRVVDLKEQGTPISSDVGQFGLGFRQEDLGSLQFSQLPKAGQRQYLMIRCLNTTQRQDVASRMHTPSYDISIRRKLEFTKIP